MSDLRYPSLYQINTRVWLTELSRALGRRATLDDIPDAELDRLAAAGLRLGLVAERLADRPGGAGDLARAIPDGAASSPKRCRTSTDEDIAGSGFAIQSYTVHRDLGGDEALARLRQRLRQRGLKLMLDFVPNHMAPDHPWIDEHPDYFVHGSEADLARAPHNYCRVQTRNGPLVLAHGRDPYFDGWPDTLQLNYGNPELQQAMIGELERIAGQCDGVRCDMAMLVLPDVFERTWGIRAEPFWPKATEAVRREHPRLPVHGRGLLGPGMDDAAAGLRLRLRQATVRPPARRGTPGRCASICTPGSTTRTSWPASWRTTTSRGRRRRSRRTSTRPRPSSRFCRRACASSTRASSRGAGNAFRRIWSGAPQEPVDAGLQGFYDRLLAVLRQPVVRDGPWSLLEWMPAWEGNWTWDCFIAWAWQRADGERLLVAVNYAANQSQCYVRLPFSDLAGRTVRLKDMMGSASFDRDWQRSHFAWSLPGSAAVGLPRLRNDRVVKAAPGVKRERCKPAL